MKNATSTSLYALRRHPASDVFKTTFSVVSFRKKIALNAISNKIFLLSKSVVLFAFSLCFLVSCTQKPETHIYQGSTMGTTYTVKVVTGPKQTVPKDLQQQIDKTLEDFNLIMSTYIENSELSRLNHAPEGAWLNVSPSLFYLLDMSKQMSQLTGGAFDVTVGPLVNLWGFGPEEREQRLPSDEVLAETRKRVGYHLFDLDLEKSAITRKADIYIDLSAIAKGFGTDIISDFLSSKGFENYMVEIGGELFLTGHNAQEELWSIGVEKPSLAHDGAVQAISVSDAGIATSGDYRNYVEIEGQRFSHTIDPATGKPITHNLASVTVIAPTGAEADALATAINVMGPERGFEFAKKYDLAVYLLIRENEGFTSKHTDSFTKYLNKL